MADEQKDGESIQLKVKNAEGKEVTFKLKMSTPLRKVSSLHFNFVSFSLWMHTVKERLSPLMESVSYMMESVSTEIKLLES